MSGLASNLYFKPMCRVHKAVVSVFAYVGAVARDRVAARFV